MDILIKNRNNKTTIEIRHDEVSYDIITEEKYDTDGNLRIPSSIIDTQGIQNPSIDRNVIINELTRRGYIIDDE
ncbi:MAG: hypothetical protein K6A78_09330 [Prevotella sp.]|nr:hypothetical protein [Prevotella sp.]